MQRWQQSGEVTSDGRGARDFDERLKIKQLAKSCISSTPVEGKSIVQVIDSTGEEFWYLPDQYVLSPGFSLKKWTKKQLIEMFNRSSNAKNQVQEYSTNSLSAKRLEKIIGDICELLKE